MPCEPKRSDCASIELPNTAQNVESHRSEYDSEILLRLSRLVLIQFASVEGHRRLNGQHRRCQQKLQNPAIRETIRSQDTRE